jgi:membrane-bound lytic murein transglycosylase B
MHSIRRSFVFFIPILFLVLTLSSTVFFIHPVDAQVADPCSANIAGKTHDELQADLDACNADIAKWTSVLNTTKQDTASYTRDVTLLTAKINAASANINAKNIAIANLGKDISVKQGTINALDQKIETGRQTLAGLLRKTNELDAYSMADAVLSDQDLSDFFVDVDTYSSTDRALQDVFAELRGTKNQTQAEKDALAKQQAAAADAKAAIEAAKKEVEVSQAQKKTLLADSKNKEKTYSSVLAERQAKAAQIKAALFPLRDTGAIQFGTALQYANAASAKTGVRPALILGILTQETNLGANVGSCVITNLTTGETKSVNSGKVFANGIHPTRDLPLLQTILKDLGRDPLTTKVSCPISVGYGGAMGPAQFIPSTWNIIVSQVASLTGNQNPDPWNPSDAIMALALLLKGDGAAGGTPSAEKDAACKYYSGRSCAAGPGASYGASVMAKAANIQTTMIDPLQGI